MTHELLGQLTARKETFSDNPVSVAQLGELMDLVQDGKITGKTSLFIQLRSYKSPLSGTSGKSLLKHIIANRSLAAPSVLAQELSLEAVSGNDKVSLRTWCAEAIEALPEEAEAVRLGNPRVLNKLVGKVMQLSRGRADAQNARIVLEDILRR
jgi:aspartyl-tRNA(Asn)/glutamyl-tRNA(Gln) amidotransferase subunit B